MLGNVTILLFSVAIKLCNNDVGCLSYFINKTFQLIFYLDFYINVYGSYCYELNIRMDDNISIIYL